MTDRHHAHLQAVVLAADTAFEAAAARPRASERPARLAFAALRAGGSRPVHPAGHQRELPACIRLEEAIETNPPGIGHAMRSGGAPLLALWLQLDGSQPGKDGAG